MYRKLLTLLLVFTFAAAPVAIVGCDKDPGDHVEDAAEDVGDAAEDATD